MTDRTGSGKPHALMAEMGITEQEIARRKAWLRFLDEDVARLQGLDRLARRWADSVIEDLYTHMFEFDEARAFFSDPAVLARVKHAQKEYFVRLAEGRYGADYVEDRLAIGAVHERVGLDVKWYLGAYNFYLQNVGTRIFEALRKHPDAALKTFLSLTKLVFLDAGLAIDTYIVRRTKRLQQELRYALDAHRGLFEGVPVGLYRTTPEGQILNANPALVQILGYPDRNTLMEANMAELYVDPEARTRWMVLMERDSTVSDFETQLRRPDGSVIWVKDGARIVRDARAEVSHYDGVMTDITGRRRADEQIQRQLQQLQAMRDIDVAIGGSLDLSVILDILVGKVIAELGVDATDVLLLESRTQTFGYAAGRGFRTAALKHTRLSLGEGYAGRAALERRVVHVPNLAEAPGEFAQAPLFKAEGFSTYHAAPLIAKGQVKGVLEVFHRSPLNLAPGWPDLLDAFARQAAIAIDNAELFAGLQRSNAELALAYDTTIQGWSHALDLRDKGTEGHTQRVTQMTLRLARALGVAEADLAHIRWGALLHDIGKMGIPDRILFKPGPLTAEEQGIVRRHPESAFELLAPIPHLRPALDIPYCHHEKWDGTGYPRGLWGEQIPLAARIFAVVDVWDALRSDRPYRPAWPEARVRAYIREQAGRHFDPRVADLFLSTEP